VADTPKRPNEKAANGKQEQEDISANDMNLQINPLPFFWEYSLHPRGVKFSIICPHSKYCDDSAYGYEVDESFDILEHKKQGLRSCQLEKTHVEHI